MSLGFCASQPRTYIGPYIYIYTYIYIYIYTYIYTYICAKVKSRTIYHNSPILGLYAVAYNYHTAFIPFFDHGTLTLPIFQVFAEVADASSYAVVRELAAAVKKEEKPVASLESMVYSNFILAFPQCSCGIG